MAEPTDAIPAGGDTDTPDLNLETPNGSIAVNTEGGNELDRLLKEATGGTPEPTEDEKKAAAEAEKKAADEATKAEADKKAAEDAAAAEAAKAKEGTTPAADEPHAFEKIELPPHAKPKTAESFSQVKTLAKEAIRGVTNDLKSEREKRQAAEAKIEELSKVSKASPEVEKELAELREFRSKVDVEFDPAFKDFDVRVTRNTQAIYDKLKAAGGDDALIEKIKALGGPAEIEWGTMADKLPSNVRRFIDAKLVENEDLVGAKGRAIEDAKKNASEYVQKRQKELTGSTVATVEETQKAVDETLPKLGWFGMKDAAKAKPEEKVAIEAHNKFVADTQSEVAEMVKDTSPQMRAMMVAGYVQLKYERAERVKQDAAHKVEVEKLTKERDEAKSLLERVKKSGTPRLRDSNAPPAGEKKVAPAKLSERSEDALDRLRDEVIAEQEA